MSTEASIEARVREYAKSKNVEFWKFTSPGRKGVPDRILIGPKGDIAFIEFKSPTGELSELQKRELTNLTKRKVRAYWFSDFIGAKAVVDSMVDRPEPTVWRKPLDHRYER